MGYSTQARCLNCGNTFMVSHGGGFFLHLVRCNRCGGMKSISTEELGELHVRYVKGLDTPYCGASREHDRYIQEHLLVEPISREQYPSGIEAFAGKCRCGGKYTLDAPPRCPNCHSTRIEEGGAVVNYD